MLISLAILLVALILLVAGAEALVRGAVGMAERLGVSSFFIGLTIVGFGTSTPELATSVIATLRGSIDISVGNVVGSNIFNIALILGVAALLCPIPVRAKVVRREVLFMIGAALIPLWGWMSGGNLGRQAGAIMLALLGLFIGYGYWAGKQEGAERALEAVAADAGVAGTRLRKSWALSLGLVALGLTLLILGSQGLVFSAVDIARRLGVSELVVALTIVAGGTSAPELVTSVVSALRKEPDISVGNILGSNIFNILGILGTAALIQPQQLGAQVLTLDAPVMIALSVACVPIMLSGGRISRWEGGLFLGCYTTYLWVLLARVPHWFPASI